MARLPRRVTEVYTSNGGTCTYTERYHFANGQIQFDRPDVNCTWRNLDMEQPPSRTDGWPQCSACARRTGQDYGDRDDGDE